ncbi:MAG: hypothetical protein Kow00107_02140 [Planctomycetota bacterium]
MVPSNPMLLVSLILKVPFGGKGESASLLLINDTLINHEATQYEIGFIFSFDGIESNATVDILLGGELVRNSETRKLPIEWREFFVEFHL